MKAAILERIGTSRKFTVKELPRPVIKKGQVLIRNYASSVNPVDLLVRQGRAVLTTAGLGNQIIGSDFSGVVIESKSRFFKEGDEVFGMINAVKGGAYAEEIAVDEHILVLKPENLDFLESAVIPLVGLTACQGVLRIGRLQRRENVLITGCTGGVGAVAVQLAKSLDADISGLCSEKHREAAKAFGCDVVIDYERQQIPAGARFDLIFDAAGKYTYSNLKHHLSERGLFVTTRGETDSLKGMVKTAVDSVLEKQMKFVLVKADVKDLLNLKGMAEQGALQLPIAATFTLEQISEAFAMMGKGGFVGKIAIQI